MGQAVSTVGGGLASYGSKYMYDFAYNNVEWVKQGASALGAAAPSAPTLSFSVYGLSYAVGGTIPATGMLGGPVYGLGGGFYFDPYSFALAVAIQVVMELKSCEPEEQQLGMHRGANLCHFVGSYCSKRSSVLAWKPPRLTAAITRCLRRSSTSKANLRLVKVGVRPKALVVVDSQSRSSRKLTFQRSIFPSLWMTS